MIKVILLIFTLLFLSNCSISENSLIWTDKEEKLENQKTLAVFKNNLVESGKNKRNILGNLAQIIAQTSSTRQRRELLENYKNLAIKFAPVEYVTTAEDIETSLGVVKTKEQQGVNTSDGDATFDSSNTNQKRQVVQPLS